MAKKPKKRTTGEVLLDMEPLILELVDQGLQFGDIIFLVYGYLCVHAPSAREEYVDGGSPVLYYGDKEGIR